MNKGTELFMAIAALVAMVVIYSLCIAATWNWMADNLWNVPKISWFQAIVAMIAIRALILPSSAPTK